MMISKTYSIDPLGIAGSLR